MTNTSESTPRSLRRSLLCALLALSLAFCLVVPGFAANDGSAL